MIAQTLTRLGGVALDLLYPPRCALCNRLGSFLCEACVQRLPRAAGRRCDVCWLPLSGEACSACAEHPMWLKRLRSPFRYEGDARKLVIDFKFGGQSSLGVPMAAALAECYSAHGLAADVIAPVPLARPRRRQRGYNQAGLLARRLADTLGVRSEDALLRVRSTQAQAAIADAEQRRENVAGAFDVAAKAEVAGLRVLLVDDVVTTGATLNECAETLIRSGASLVLGLTFTRAD